MDTFVISDNLVITFGDDTFAINSDITKDDIIAWGRSHNFLVRILEAPLTEQTKHKAIMFASAYFNQRAAREE